MVKDTLECSDKDTERTISQMIPDLRIEDLLYMYSDEYGEDEKQRYNSRFNTG